MISPVYMLYAEGHRFRGSVIMRLHQLAQFATRYLGARYRFVPVMMPKAKLRPHLSACDDLTGGLVFLSKSMVHNLEPDAFARLKETNRAVLGDWIDRGFRSRHKAGIDIHLAASMAFRDYVAETEPAARVRLLTHHADPRLEALSFGPLERLAPVYLGHAGNIPDYPELEGRITMARAKRDSAFADFLPRLPEFNLHYNVRAGLEADEAGFKPFTKGFTAAACRSNILLQRDVDDAVAYLGADYPYFVEDNTLESVRAGLDFAQDSFGGPDWRHGLEVMRAVAERSSPAHVAGELGAILDEAMAL